MSGITVQAKRVKTSEKLQKLADGIWLERRMFLVEKALDNLHKFYIFETQYGQDAHKQLINFLDTLKQRLASESLPLPFKCQCMYKISHANMFQISITSDGKKRVVILESANYHRYLFQLIRLFLQHDFEIAYGVSSYVSSRGNDISFQNDSISCATYALFFMWKARNEELWDYVEKDSAQDSSKTKLIIQLDLLPDSPEHELLRKIKTFDIRMLPNNFFKVTQSIKILKEKYTTEELENFAKKGTIKTDSEGVAFNTYLSEHFDDEVSRRIYRNFQTRFSNYVPFWRRLNKDDVNPDITAYTENDKDLVADVMLWGEKEPSEYLTAWCAKAKPSPI